MTATLPSAWQQVEVSRILQDDHYKMDVPCQIMCGTFNDFEFHCSMAKSAELFVCLFVCLFEVFRPTGDFFFTYMETPPSPVKGCRFCHRAVRHLLCPGASVYDGLLRGSMTLIPGAERLALELSLPVFTTKICRG